MAALLQQLVQQHSVISDEVHELYKSHITKRTRPSLAEFSKLLQSEINGYSKVFVIVDALDECNEKDMTRLVTELLHLPRHLQLLFTSRYSPDIEPKFKDMPRLEIRASDADVRNYLHSLVEKEDFCLHRYIQKDASLRSTIIDTIAEKSKGMFVLLRQPS